MPIPIYQEYGKTYEADSCRPVEEAARVGRLHHEALVHGHYPGRRLPPKALSGVKSVGFWDADRRQDWGLDWHRNEGIELTFLKRGKLGFTVDNNPDCILQAGDLTITRPWQRHRIGNPHIDANRLYFLILDIGVRRPHQTWRWPSWVILSKGDLRQLTNLLRHNEQPVWQATTEIVRAFEQIGKAVETDRNGSEVSHLAVQINQLLLSLLEMLQRQNASIDTSLSSTCHTVELFWGDLCRDGDQLACDWSIRDMAKRCGMGSTSFINHSKQLFNMTPMQYLNRCRLDRAARFLKVQSKQSVTNIALSCGFASAQYYATMFRRQFGVTPRQYRITSKTL